MKTIKTQHAQENHVLAQDIYNPEGSLVYNKGTALSVFVRTSTFLEGYETIEVYEDKTEYLVEEVIRSDLQQKTVQQLRHLEKITGLEDQGPEDIRLNIIRAMVGSVVEDFFNERIVMEKLVNMRDVHEYLYQHSVGVMITSLLLGTSMGLEREALRNLGLGAILHDIGMLFIPAHIMNKEKLLEEEYGLIKKHPVLGYEFLVKHTQLSNEILSPVLQHQERWDGSGYPDGLKADEISLYGQIIGLADMFDSMTSNRIYRKAYPVSEAYEYIMGDAGQQFNPQLIQAFVTNINPYPPNTLVELNDGSVGVVIRSNSPFHTRPLLKIVKGSLKGKEIDLLIQRNLVIVATISSTTTSEKEK